MGAVTVASTLTGGKTPICNACGATEPYDISEQEYDAHYSYWDNWICPPCKPTRNY